MSASRDKSQKIAFVYSNLYQLYRKGKEAATQSNPAPAPTPTPGLTTARILKAETLRAPDLEKPFLALPKVREYTPAELIAAHLPKREAAAPKLVSKQTDYQPILGEKAEARLGVQAQNEAVESLKGNLKALNELHSRLRFMLQELEDLVKE